jgi:hypothetical protein
MGWMMIGKVSGSPRVAIMVMNGDPEHGQRMMDAYLPEPGALPSSVHFSGTLLPAGDTLT